MTREIKAEATTRINSESRHSFRETFPQLADCHHVFTTEATLVVQIFLED